MGRIALVLFALFLVSCSSNPHKAEEIETRTDKTDAVTTRESVGTNSKDEMVYVSKSKASDDLRKLQDEVWELEDKVYGTRRYGTRGLYGKYADCLRTVSPEGKAQLPKLDAMDRWSDKDPDFKLGVDPESKTLTSLTTEKLKDRIARFQEYRRILQQKEDEYSDNLQSCQAKR